MLVEIEALVMEFAWLCCHELKGLQTLYADIASQTSRLPSYLISVDQGRSQFLRGNSLDG